MSNGSFDLYQQVFTLSTMANGDSNNEEAEKTALQLQADLLASIQGKLANSGLQKLIGDSWQIAWGPFVYQNETPGDADNAMYVAYDPSSNVYVVAIAGTNYLSKFDWTQEDAGVAQIQDWKFGKNVPSGVTFPADVKIAPGTVKGVSLLLQMPGQGQTGTPLATWLKGVQSSDATLIFTGHSLGGALSPALAMALVTQGVIDLSQWKAVYVYPTAGPTPGNAGLCALFSALFPQTSLGTQPWQAWNSLIWNSLDVVPHAWNETMLPQVPRLYAPTIPAPPDILAKVAGAEVLAALQGYQQLQSYGPLAGELGTVSGSTADQQFDNQALYQHVNAYKQLLGVEALLSLKDAEGNPLFGLPGNNPPTQAA